MSPYYVNKTSLFPVGNRSYIMKCSWRRGPPPPPMKILLFKCLVVAQTCMDLNTQIHRVQENTIMDVCHLVFLLSAAPPHTAGALLYVFLPSDSHHSVHHCQPPFILLFKCHHLKDIFRNTLFFYHLILVRRQ